MKIGVINDTHNWYQDEPSGTRKCSYAVQWLDEVLNQPEMQNLDQLLFLGDIVHDYNDSSDGTTYFAQIKNKANEYYPNDKICWCLGNHDFFGDMTVEQVVSALGMPSNYYYRDVGYIRFIILDAQYNTDDTHRQNTTYSFGHIPESELNWLEQTLASTEYNAIIGVHQLLAETSMSDNKYFSSNPSNARIDNRVEVRQIIEKYKDKVLYVLQGHSHFDRASIINGVLYMQFGSLVDTWSPEKKRTRILTV